MTDYDANPRRRGTWSARAPWNRIAYAFIAAWAVWLIAGRPSQWVVLPLTAAAWLAITGFLAVRDRQAGTDRQR